MTVTPEQLRADRCISHHYACDCREERMRQLERVAKVAKETYERQTDPHARWAMEDIAHALAAVKGGV